MTQDWYAAMEHLKCAFKDESTVSNIGLANLSFEGDSNPGIGDNDSDSNSNSNSNSNSSDSDSTSNSSEVQLENYHQQENPQELELEQKEIPEMEEREPLKELQQLGDCCGPRQNQNPNLSQNQIQLEGQHQEATSSSAVSVKSIESAEAGIEKTPSLVNIDEEFSYRSYSPTNEDRYDPYFFRQTTCKQPEMPGIIDVSSIQSGEGNSNSNISNISNNNFNNDLLSSKIHMLLDTSLEIPDDISGDLSNDDLMSGSSGSASGSNGSTTDGGSLLLNVWNEDYDGNPDPETMKKLLEAKHLPRNIDPYVVNQIQRARIIQQLHEIDDDLSSVGSCNVMCTQMFLPRRCADAEDDDDDAEEGSSLASDDSIVDTVIDINPSDNIEDIASYASVDASIEIEGFNHKKPKQNIMNSKYAIPKDKDYRPGVTPNELVLMLPKKSNTNKKHLTNPHLPVQYAVGDSDDEMSSNGSSEKTYQEKNMEFTLQRYDSTPHRIAELVLKGQKSAAMDILPPEPVLSCLSEELDQVTYKIRRRTDDDDPIEEDRSILNEEELETEKREKDELLQAFHNRPPQPEELDEHYEPEGSDEVEGSSDCQVTEIIGIFNGKQNCFCAEKHQSKAEDKDINKLSVPQILSVDNELPLLTAVSTESVPEQLSDDNIFKAGEVRSLSNDEDRQLCAKDTATTKDDLRSMPLLSYSSAESASFDQLGSASQEETIKSCKSRENEQVPCETLGPIEEGKDKENQGSNEERNTPAENTIVDDNNSTPDANDLKRGTAEKSELEVIRPQDIKHLMEERVLRSLGKESETTSTGNGKVCSKICHIVNATNCCRQDPSKVTYEGEDENVEELIRMANTSITTTSSVSGESAASSPLEQEVVVGVAVEGIKFESPFSQMGMIIDPDQFEALRQLQMEQPDVDLSVKRSEACVKFEESAKSEVGSSTSEQYAAMILEVTNVEDSAMNDTMNQRTSELSQDLNNTREVTVESEDGDVANVVEKTAEIDEQIEVSSELKGMELFHLCRDETSVAKNDDTGVNHAFFRSKTIIKVGSNIEVSRKLLRNDSDDECDSQSSMVAIIESAENADNASCGINEELMDGIGEEKTPNKEATTSIEDQLSDLKRNMKKNSRRLSKITNGRSSPAVSLNLLDSATEFDAVMAFQV